jgi:hypothetical protein
VKRPPLDGERLSDVPDPFAGDPGALPPPPPLPPEPPPTRAQHHWRLLATGMIAVLFQIGWIVAWRRRVTLADLSSLQLAVGLGVPLAGAILLWLAAARRGGQGLGTRTVWLATGILSVPLLFAVATLAFAPADHDESAAALLGGALRCVVGSAILCAVSLTLFGLAFRGAFAAGSRWRSAALGGACGALTTATMSVACPNGALIHVLLGHGTIIVLGGAIGGLLGRFTRA